MCNFSLLELQHALISIYDVFDFKGGGIEWYVSLFLACQLFQTYFISFAWGLNLSLTSKKMGPNPSAANRAFEQWHHP